MDYSDTSKVILTAEKLNITSGKYESYNLDGSTTAKTWTALTDADEDGNSKIIKGALYNMEESTLTLEIGTYNFALEVYTWTSSTDSTEHLSQTAALEAFEVSASTETISFTTTYAGNGSLALTFKWAADSDKAGKIRRIDAGLFTLESKGETAATDASGKVSYDYEELTLTSDSDAYSADYAKSGLPNGTYLLKYRVYDSYGTNVLNTIADFVKIHGFKTENTITLDLDKINSLPQGAGGVVIDDSRISIKAEPDGSLYLNSGTIAISATDSNGEQIDTSNITAKLLYGGAVLDSEFWQWLDDGFVMLGTGEKLATGGTYQLLVTASADAGTTTVTGSNTFNIQVEDKEFYEIDVSDANYAETLANAMKQLDAPAIVKVTGAGIDTVTGGEAGTLKNISETINNNKMYGVALDLSELTEVTKIVTDDFESCAYIQSIALPQTITSLESSAFDRCTALTTVTIPASVSSIAGGAFYYCSALEKFELDSSNTVFATLSDGALLTTSATGDTSKTKIVAAAPASFSGQSLDFEADYPNVTEIEEAAFRNTKGLTSVTIGSTITSIGGSAFSDCEITSLTLEALPTTIGTTAFYNAHLSHSFREAVQAETEFAICKRLCSTGMRISKIQRAAPDQLLPIAIQKRYSIVLTLHSLLFPLIRAHMSEHTSWLAFQHLNPSLLVRLMMVMHPKSKCMRLADIPTNFTTIPSQQLI